MNMKILSPAGDMESLKCAVYNGADEVYLGVKDFNARNIEGFSLFTLAEAVRFALIFGVRVFLTVNILFTDDEMQSALDLVVDAYNLGVDAFIIQDIGLASIIHEHYPMIELHASTQMGIHNLEGVRAVEHLGFKRVVLSRETPIAEIKRIRDNSDIEIEYFVQGALCVSFSGNCYLSSYMLDASGNRGKCKQLCRLPYTFMKGDKKIKDGYLLSAKDICLIDRLAELEDAGVNSLKIEGRARRPYYVAVATREYRRALDGLPIDEEELRLAYNRQYTPAYFDGNGDIISNRQNHIGIEIGRVTRFREGKKFNEIFISSSRPISAKSTLKFFDNDSEIATISAYDIQSVDGGYRITTTQKVEVGNSVNIISDYAKEDQTVNYQTRRPIDIKIIARVGEPISAELILNDQHISILGEVCAESKSSPITHEELVKNFAKSEYFEAQIVSDIDNVFLPKKLLNDFRRKVFDKVYEILTRVDRQSIEKLTLYPAKQVEEMRDFHIIRDCRAKLEREVIIYSPEVYDLDDIVSMRDRCTKENKTFILNLPNFALKEDVDYLRNIVEKSNVAIMINNLYALDFQTEKYIGGGMNVYNSYSATYLDLPYISAENGEFRMPYMTLRHCPMKEHMNGNCSNCPYTNDYKYVMNNGKTLNLQRVKMSSCTFYLD